MQAGDLGSAFWVRHFSAARAISAIQRGSQAQIADYDRSNLLACGSQRRQSLAIAIHTSAFIIWRYKPSALVVGLTVAFIWIVVILMCAIGPIHVRVLRAQGHEAGPFYDNAGLWCWMSTEYDPWRLWAHYLFVFISAFGSLVAYFAVFAFLYFRLFQRGVYNHHLFNLRRAADGKLVPTSNSPQPAQAAKVAIARRRTMDTEASNRGRKVDRAALIMLLFPATYVEQKP